MSMVNYGVSDALGPFLLHQLVNTMTATVSTDCVSMKVQDVILAILRVSVPD